MKKTRIALTIVITLLTLTITSQPAMSRNSENILTGAVLGATVGALIASQVGYYPNQQYVTISRPQFYSPPVLMVPPPDFRPRPVIYVPQPRHYKRHHRYHRKHWKRNGGRARW
jgi:hypothetical protein